MPTRKIPLVTGEVYHVFNRGIDRRPTFTTKREFERALITAGYYKFSSSPIRLSKFLVKPISERDLIMSKLQNTESLVNIFSYCLMPNHFHFLLRQRKEGGISKFLSNFLNSFTKFFNTRHNKRLGPLFLGQSKAVLIETDEQLIHVSRYIHLNPYTSHIVETLDELIAYPWSSLKVYLNTEDYSTCDREFILQLFNNKPENYKKFILNQADYQRKLKKIRHLTLE